MVSMCWACCACYMSKLAFPCSSHSIFEAPSASLYIVRMLRPGAHQVTQPTRAGMVCTRTVHSPVAARSSNQSEAAQAAEQAAKARDAVQRAQFSAMGNVTSQMDAVADAQLELNAQAASLLASLGLSDAAQQLQQKNREAEAKLKEIKTNGAQLNLMGLVQNHITQDDDQKE